jgi:hypothetical protein
VDYGLDSRGIGFDTGNMQEIFRFSTAHCNVRLAVEPTRLTGGWVPARVKRSGREAEHSPSPSAQVKNTWKYMHHLP